jgi:hypothetical protein
MQALRECPNARLRLWVVRGKVREHAARGYSEQAAEVLRQPGRIAWDIFDAHIAGVAVMGGRADEASACAPPG